jgi:hypothetical protein
MHICSDGFKIFKAVALFSVITVNAKGIENFLPGSRSASLADCSVTLSDLWSVSNNQAGLAFLEKSSAGISFERKFMLKELGVRTLAAAFLCKPGTFGFSYTYFGYQKYHESKAGFAFSRKLAKNLAAGVQMDYFNAFCAGSGSNLQKISYEIGILSYPLRDFAIGLHLLNPIPGKLNNKAEPDLSSITRLGCSYLLRNSIMLAVEVCKNLTQRPVFNAGFEYVPMKVFSLRFGVSTGTSIYDFGLGFQSKRFWFDTAFTKHQVLGITPKFDLGINF